MSMTTDNLNIRGTFEYQTAHFRGFWQRAKNRLEQERSAHKDELRRLDATDRQQLNGLERFLVKRLEDEFNRKFSELEDKYRKQVEVYQGRIAELESELSLFRDQVKGTGNKENLNFSGDRVHLHNKRKKGGKKPGAPGGGLLHKELPVVDDEVTLEEDQLLCQICSLPYELIDSSEDSEVVEWQYRLVRIRRRRRKYHRGCQCLARVSWFGM